MTVGKRMVRNVQRYTLILFLTQAGVGCCLTRGDSSGPQTRLFPLGKEWFVENDIDLPLPFGVSGFFAYMSRGIDISDVEVAFLDESKQSINDFAAFELQNQSLVSAAKLDMWLFPFVNVYGLLGNVNTNASLDATITIDRVVLPGPPIIVPINQTSTINGLYYGIGTTAVAGHKNWFVLGDANYGYSNLDESQGHIDFWMFSGRSGLQSRIGENQLRTWIGGMYLASNRTLRLNVENETLGLIDIDVYQETNDPFTVQLGSSMGLGKRFEILTELGSNFRDASIGVLSVSYRS